MLNFAPSRNGEYRRVNAAILAQGAEAFVEERLPEGTRQGDTWRCGDVSGTAGGSLCVDLTTGAWYDHADPDTCGGDFVSLHAAIEDIEQHEALAKLNQSFPVTNGQSLPETKDLERGWWMGVKPDHTWAYYDADGEVLFEVYRHDARDGRKKEIHPWCPATGKYQYPPDLELRPLLDGHSIKGSTDTVVLVGGEKCVDAVREAGLGLCATTNAGGESAVAKTDYSPLADRDVILWPDNDKAGVLWLSRTLEALDKAGAESVRVVEVPPSTPDGWDAADASLEQRSEILNTAYTAKPVWRNSMELNLTDVTNTEPSKREWLITGAIPRNIAAILVGQGGCGKSIAALDMCIKVATRGFYNKRGTPRETFLGPVDWEARGPAVFITLEEDRNEIHRRALALDPDRIHAQSEHGVDVHPVLVILGTEEMNFDPTLITTSRERISILTHYAEFGLPRMMERIKAKEGVYPKLVVLDPIGDFIEGPEDDSSLVKPLMLYFRRMAEKYQCTMLLIGHTPKARPDRADPLGSISPRGSGAWAANSRCAFGLYRPIPASAITFLKAISVDVTPFTVSRVVFGGRLKENQPGARHGVRKYLQDADSGLLIDMTEHVREEKPSEDRTRALIVHAIRIGALMDMPFTGRELRSRVDALPPGLVLPGRHTLDEWLAELKEAKLIKSCRITGESHKFLDVPGGPYATGTRTSGDRLTGEFPDNAYELHPFEEGAGND